MLLFCPTCANSLTVAIDPNTSTNRLECRTCPYQFPIDKQYYERKDFARVERIDMFGGTDQFANVPRTKQNCPNKDCDGREAWYSQAQTRSADEGSTNTYTCVKCRHVWKENN